MKRTLFLFVVVCITAKSVAQQDPLYSQYINNPFVLNPAYAGLSNNLSAAVSYRQQWAGYEGNPVTINANGHLSLSSNTMGAGLMIVSDEIGATTVNEVYASYSYRIKLSADKILSFGLQAGIVNFKTDNSKLLIQDPADPVFGENVSETKPSIGSGIILTGDRFFIGLSVPRMLSVTLAEENISSTVYTQHYYATGSYLFFASERIKIRPSLLTKFVNGAPLSVDVNAAMILDEKYTGGLLTRNFSTYGVFLQGIFKDAFRLGYTFEVPTNKSVGTNFLTHEITLGFSANIFRFHANSGINSF
jgi:type IX secretion system PorP/SprF family membrane protein